jgi:4-diphosphocytidyl-2-C-methyl-D-erythritol kinase
VNPTQLSSQVHYAPCKINLGLEIIERRADGYHDLQSIFVAVSLYDTLTIETLTDDIVVQCHPSVTSDPRDNIVHKAATLLKNVLGASHKGAKITLHKNIPTGAGLGGGSSDAATTLTALNLLWDAGLSKTDLLTLAGTLGSDVPFFVNPQPSLVKGRGDILQPLDVLPHLDVVIVAPSIHINTAWAYSTLNRKGHREPSDLLAAYSVLAAEHAIPPNALVNDFEPVISFHHPVLRDIRATLLSFSPLFVSMSGSGSAMYALFQRGTAPTNVADIFAPHAAFSCLTL